MAARAPKALIPAWVGLRPHRVWVGARAEKKGVVYLRWRRGNNWAWRSLRFTLAGKDRAERAALEARAYESALDQYERLTGRRAPAADRSKRPLVLGDAWALLTDPVRGRHPTDTPYRREFAWALATAARYLGADFPFVALNRARLREVTRRHAEAVLRKGETGFRSAQVLGTRLLTITRQLRDEGHLPEDLAIPGGREWHAELRAFVEAKTGAPLPPPFQPRYTLEEFRALLDAAPAVDPRFALMFSLGAELRGGQVARARRSHLDPVARLFTVHGRGKKKGTTIELTAGQMAAVETALGPGGYLVDLEAGWLATGTDYPLFPSVLGAGTGAAKRAVPGIQASAGKKQIEKWMHRCEAEAGVPRVAGRSWHGGRRAAVDASLDEHISEGALQNIGGWIDGRTPKETYRERGRLSERTEAMEVRSRLRGEVGE